MPAAHTALVIGGGIAGPVAAAALAKAGIEASVYESRPADPSAANGIGGSLALEPNGLAALRIIDADHAVRKAAIPITRSVMSIASKPGREVPAPPGLPPRQLIDRGALHRILRERAHRAGVRILDGRRLIGVDERVDGITAHFADGTHASADVLIGADGVHSTVRRLIDPGAPAAGYTGLLGFEGLVDDAADTADLAPGTMTFAFGRRAYYLYWKRPDGRIGWGANLPSPQHVSLRAGPRDSGRGLAGQAAGRLRRRHARRTRLRRKPHPTFFRSSAACTSCRRCRTGTATAWFWSATRCTRRRTAPGRARRWRWRARSSWPAACATCPTCRRHSAAYEELRRPRVEKIAARGAKISRAKAPGPIAQRMMRLLLPVMMRTMNTEKTLGVEQRHTIDWDAPVEDEVAALA